MRKTVHAAAVAFMALQMGGTPAAHAADLDLPPLWQPQASPMVEFGSGWYLRGDVGYVGLGKPSYTYGDTTSYTVLSGTPEPNYVSSSSAQSMLTNPMNSVGAFGATLGAGYSFNNWFRMDATFDWRQTQIGSSTTSYVPSYGNPIVGGNPTYYGGGCVGPTDTPTTCYKTDQTQIQSWTGLLNAYGDLGTWGGFTPYVGGGLGVTSLRVSTSENWYFSSGVPYGNGGANNYCPPNLGYCYANGFNGNTSPSQIRDNFSWALMAGLSYDVMPHVKLDIGYRYLNMGTLTGTNAAGNIIHSTISSQEVRAGLRFTPDL